MIDLRFGAMAPRISEQLNDQGFTAAAVTMAEWQRSAEAASLLSVYRLLTNAERQAVYGRLAKEIRRIAYRRTK